MRRLQGMVGTLMFLWVKKSVLFEYIHVARPARHSGIVIGK